MTNMEILANAYIPFRETMTAQEYNKRLEIIRDEIVPYYDRKKPKKVTHNERANYFGQIVAEALKSIRRAGVDYLFREEQVVELLRYEPAAQIEYKKQWGCWEIWLPAA